MTYRLDRQDVPREVQVAWSQADALPCIQIFTPDADYEHGLSLDGVLSVLGESVSSPPPGLVPVAAVDGGSIACFTTTANKSHGWKRGQIIRWHLDVIRPEFQGKILDTSLRGYLRSMADELGPARERGLAGMHALAREYAKKFLEPDEKPKAKDLRPFQLACQNVIVGLAAFKRDLNIDGHSAPYFMSCEAPHVATLDGTRCISAIMLCDAFQAGGTMEISFSEHPEGRVPAVLRRYARTLNISLGVSSSGGKSISPAGARALFQAVTPMPESLRELSATFVDGGVLSVERLCYALLSSTWSAASLEFLMACASPRRIKSILYGGADVFERESRSPEMELMRASLMLDILIQRLDLKDEVGAGNAVRIFEDTRYGLEWVVRGDFGAVTLVGGAPTARAWGRELQTEGPFTVLPRPHPLPGDFEVARQLRDSHPELGPIVVLSLSQSAQAEGTDVPVITCPVRISELDLQIERKLASSAVGRS